MSLVRKVFSLDDTTSRSETQRRQRVLVTSSYDHTIRLWWKGSCQRCLRGHNRPVTCLSDRLLGDGSAKVLASGGVDGTVRLWSLSLSGKRGQQALKATLHGHEKPIKQISVAEHNTSLLVTISNDSKVRVWDTSTSTSVRSSCCLGMITVPGAPVDMKFCESLLYVASGSSVVTIDLRTMQKVGVPAICQSNLFSFAMLPSKHLFCTGGINKGMLWDSRRNQESVKPEPVAELEGHMGPITQLEADRYKIVGGGPEDSRVNIWEADNGTPTNSLLCCGSESEDAETASSGCMAMAVDGNRIVTAATSGAEYGVVRFRDFLNATEPVSRARDDNNSSKFWDQ
ncbi:F-box protein MET30 [Linum grandiflorum]